jgi:hypothetical protein
VIMGLFNMGYISAIQTTTLEATRNFYGVLRIKEGTEDASGEPILLMSHGVTNHGYQYVDPDLHGTPTAYYGRSTGSGIAFSQYRELLSEGEQEAGLRVGIIGLGTGTLAAYARPDDYLRFYEINPDVIRLAEGDQGYFTFLSDTKGEYDIIVGDARVSLEKELSLGQKQDFDLFFIDAFNGDSVPVHLLTREAFEVYLAHMKPEGILAFNVTNRHLDLPSVVQQQADHFGLRSILINTGEDGKELTLKWMLLSYNDKFFEQPEIAAHLDPGREAEGKRNRMWTDDYSNLFQILK